MRVVAALILLVCLAALAGCVTYEAIPLTEIGTVVEPGDHLIVTTYEGDELIFVALAIDDSSPAVVGADIKVPFADIALIERKRYGWGESAAFLSGALLVTGGLLALAIVVTFG